MIPTPFKKTNIFAKGMNIIKKKEPSIDYAANYGKEILLKTPRAGDDIWVSGIIERITKRDGPDNDLYNIITTDNRMNTVSSGQPNGRSAHIPYSIEVNNPHIYLLEVEKVVNKTFDSIDVRAHLETSPDHTKKSEDINSVINDLDNIVQNYVPLKK